MKIKSILSLITLMYLSCSQHVSNMSNRGNHSSGMLLVKDKECYKYSNWDIGIERVHMVDMQIKKTDKGKFFFGKIIIDIPFNKKNYTEKKGVFITKMEKKGNIYCLIDTIAVTDSNGNFSFQYNKSEDMYIMINEDSISGFSYRVKDYVK